MHYRLLAYVVNNYPFIFYDTVKVHRSGHQGVLRLSNWHTPVGYIYNITLYYIILHYKYCNVNNKVHRVQSSMTCVLLTAHNVCSQPDSTKMCSQPDSTKMSVSLTQLKLVCSQPDSMVTRPISLVRGWGLGTRPLPSHRNAPGYARN